MAGVKIFLARPKKDLAILADFSPIYAVVGNRCWQYDGLYTLFF